MSENEDPLPEWLKQVFSGDIADEALMQDLSPIVRKFIADNLVFQAARRNRMTYFWTALFADARMREDLPNYERLPGGPGVPCRRRPSWISNGCSSRE